MKEILRSWLTSPRGVVPLGPVPKSPITPVWVSLPAPRFAHAQISGLHPFLPQSATPVPAVNVSDTMEVKRAKTCVQAVIHRSSCV